MESKQRCDDSYVGAHATRLPAGLPDVGSKGIRAGIKHSVQLGVALRTVVPAGMWQASGIMYKQGRSPQPSRASAHAAAPAGSGACCCAAVGCLGVAPNSEMSSSLRRGSSCSMGMPVSNCLASCREESGRSSKADRAKR